MSNAAPLRRLLTVVTVCALAGPVTGLAAMPSVAHADTGGFRVGAAVASYAPPCGPDGTPAANNCTPAPAGFTDPADCLATADNVLPAGTSPSTQFTGKRLFAFEEPYQDQQGDGHYDMGDPFVDCNADGRWDGNFIGGGSDAPRYYDYVADPPGARAMVVSNGTKTIAVGVFDNEGVFNTYFDAVRSDVAAALPSGASLDSNNIFLSSTHDESAPDSIGLYGVTPVTSSANLYWISYMETQAAKAIVDAYKAMEPATITYAEAIQPANFRQCWSSYPLVDDQLVPTLQARSIATGKAIATIADVSQHTETLGFNGGSQVDPGDPAKHTLDQEKTWITGDWPYWMRKSIEDTDGGVGIEMAGSVGSNETPQIFTHPISRTPQQFVDAGHPAGCRTEFVGDQNDTVPLGYYSETKELGTQLATAIEGALSKGTVSQSTEISGARQDICVEVTNALFAAAGVGGVFGQRPSYADPNCTVPAPLPPSGNTGALFIKSAVAAFQIGDGTFASLPGEVFPFTFLRGFLGPEDLPCPDPNTSGDCGGPANPTVSCTQGANAYAMPPWLMPHMHTPYRFLDGLGEDMAGYIFPCANGIGVPGEYPVSNPSADATDRFGCGHSDDSESASSDLSDVIGDATANALDNLDGSARAPEDIEQGRYVLPGGALSRDPLGTTDSIGCTSTSPSPTTSTTFDQSGPAVAIQLADGTVVHPAQWMSLSGRPQPDGPDRNTRGWIDSDGTRHWLDVYAATPPGGDLPEVPTPALLLAAGMLALLVATILRRRLRARAH